MAQNLSKIYELCEQVLVETSSVMKKQSFDEAVRIYFCRWKKMALSARYYKKKSSDLWIIELDDDETKTIIRSDKSAAAKDFSKKVFSLMKRIEEDPKVQGTIHPKNIISFSEKLKKLNIAAKIMNKKSANIKKLPQMDRIAE